MMYVGERPWHGLGTELKEAATAEQAIVAAGLDWEVEKRRVFLPGNVEATGFKAVVRQDTGDILNILRNDFTPVQNRVAFNFFDEIVGGGQAIYHTAGALGKGQRVWILAKLPGDIIIEKGDGKDSIEKFLLLANGHDGSLALRMMFTPVRVVCQNTLSTALGQGGANGVYLRHSENIEGRAAEARRTLGIALKCYDDFGAKANQLADIKIASKIKLYDYIDECLPQRKGEKPEKQIERRNNVFNLFEGAATNNVGRVGGTWWAAYNSVTEFVDFGGGEERKEITSARLNSNWLGEGASAKRRALDLALEAAGVPN
jgi:phage/plasmid-like protein (TIGR03299 family)